MMMWTTHQVQIAWGCRRAGGSAPDDAVGWLGAAARGVVQRSEAHDNGQRNACPRQVKPSRVTASKRSQGQPQIGEGW